MKKVIYLSVLFVSFVGYSSCKKKLSAANQELVGTWTNDETTTIQINANGKGYSHYSDGGSYKNIDGKVIVKGETITIKAFGIKEIYQIDQRPYNFKGETYMELNGDDYRLE